MGKWVSRPLEFGDLKGSCNKGMYEILGIDSVISSSWVKSVIYYKSVKLI